MIFFHFFKILIFQAVKGVKGQKMLQNDKKFCLSHSISQEPYIIWLSFMVHMCKMIISPGVLLSFSKFWFSGLSEVKGQKLAQNEKNSVAPYISGTIYHMIFIYGTCVCINGQYLKAFFSFFQNFNFQDH